MIQIYCDASTDLNTRLCAWGYIIKYKNKEYAYSNHRILNTVSSNHGELLAVVKALGNIKGFKSKSVVVYTDFQPIIDICKKYNSPKSIRHIIKKICNDDKSLYCCLFKYFSLYKLKIEKIPRKENPAHAVAYRKLQKARAEIKVD